MRYYYCSKNSQNTKKGILRLQKNISTWLLRILFSIASSKIYLIFLFLHQSKQISNLQIYLLVQVDSDLPCKEQEADVSTLLNLSQMLNKHIWQTMERCLLAILQRNLQKVIFQIILMSCVPVFHASHSAFLVSKKDLQTHEALFSLTFVKYQKENILLLFSQRT